jgi:tetratricopeptide (TPR) repeat protein
MKARILIIPLLLLLMSSYAATPDSSLFTTEFEHRMFNSLTNSTHIDSIDLFIALSYTSSSKDKVYRFSDALKAKISEYPVSKKLKTVYKAVHDEFFTKYSLESNFNEIFLNGNYNCLTASALYAIILDRLGIKYIIKQTPAHVYIIADPSNTGYLIETTLPGEKIVQFDDRFKNNYIEYLHNNKIIADSEFRNSSVDVLFEAYYFQDKTVSIKELAGLHYSNYGIFRHNKSDYTAALVNFEKAELLYPDQLIRFLKNNALLNVLDQENQKKAYKGKTLAKYISSNDSSSDGLTYGKDYFEAVSAELVVNHPNIQAYKTYFDELSPSLNPVKSSEIYRIYYFFLGFFDCVNYRYAQALTYLEKAYQYNPDNINTRGLVSETVTKHIVTDRQYPRAIDSLNHYFSKFPFLVQDKTLMNYMEYCYALSIESYFSAGDAQQGYRMLGAYESFLTLHPEFEANKTYTKLIYQQIGFYHLSQNQYDKAEQILRKGIRLVPDALELKGYLRSVMTAKGGNYEYPELMDDKKPIKAYLLAIARAKDNAVAINQNAEKFLTQKWQIQKIFEGGVGESLPENEKVTFHLMDGNKVIYHAGSVTNAGKWNYNNTKCLIDFTIENIKEVMHIVITDISAKELKGVMYVDDEYEDSYEVWMMAKD